jgi:hypothetical protein
MLAKRAKPPPDSAFGGTNEWTLPGLSGVGGSGFSEDCSDALALDGFAEGTAGSGLSARSGVIDEDAALGPGGVPEGRLLSASNCCDERWVSLLSAGFELDAPNVLALESTDERDVIRVGAMT